MVSWHRLSPSYLMLVALSRKPKNQGVKTLLTAKVCERSRHLFGLPMTREPGDTSRRQTFPIQLRAGG